MWRETHSSYINIVLVNWITGVQFLVWTVRFSFFITHNFLASGYLGYRDY
jgi:hypothetical protein